MTMAAAAPPAATFPAWDYREYPRSLPQDDLWGQVRRTLGGRAVPEEEIQRIVADVVREIELSRDDVVLDIGCGNGALTDRLATTGGSWLGVDASPYLIEVAQQRFAGATQQYCCQDALEYVSREAHPQRFTKVLAFALLGYLEDAYVAELLATLRRRFTGLRLVVLGNLADRARAAAFHGGRAFDAAELDTPCSAIGVWRDRAHIARLAHAAGWNAAFPPVDGAGYQAHYRYHARLTPRRGAA